MAIGSATRAAAGRPFGGRPRTGPAASPLGASRRVALGLAAGGALAAAGAGAGAAALSRASDAGVVEWPAGAPAELGLDAGGLERLRRGLAARGSASLLVARGGTLALEWYDPKPRHLLRDPRARRHGVASAAKALLATTGLVLCVADGLVGLDEPAALHLPGWARDPVRSRITLRQLASHTSGLANPRHAEWEEGGVEPWEELYWSRPSARTRLSLERAPLLAAPGTALRYSNAGYSVLAAALAKALHAGPRTDLATLLRERVARPLGVADAAWSVSAENSFAWDGVPVHEVAGGCTLTPRAVARLGQLHLQGGRWDGRAPLDPAVLAACLRPAGAPLPADWRAARQPAPALGWWSNANGAWRSAPADALVAAGSSHRVLVVVPSLDLVAVRTGNAPLGRSRFGGDFWAAFEDAMLAPLLAATRA